MLNTDDLSEKSTFLSNLPTKCVSDILNNSNIVQYNIHHIFYQYILKNIVVLMENK